MGGTPPIITPFVHGCYNKLMIHPPKQAPIPVKTQDPDRGRRPPNSVCNPTSQHPPGTPPSQPSTVKSFSIPIAACGQPWATLTPPPLKSPLS